MTEEERITKEHNMELKRFATEMAMKQQAQMDFNALELAKKIYDWLKEEETNVD